MVLKEGKPHNLRPVISLFEGRHGNNTERPPSLVDLIVKEQMRLMALGKSKGDSLAAAVDLVSAANKDFVIMPKASFFPTEL